MTPCDRRDFVRTAAGALSAAALAPLLGACAALTARVVPTREGRLELALAHYPELAAPGGALKVRPDGAETPIFVLAQEGGEFLALSPLCTHLGCVVELQGTRIVCPCHGSTFDRAGAVLQGPASDPLERYPLTVSSDGVITIDVRGHA
jgi:cytochrome b6-f complex iron-sulfur subunit